MIFTVADIVRHGRVGGRGTTAPRPTPEQVETTLRRSRGLLRADQLEAWLASWRISPDDFRAWTRDQADGTDRAPRWCDFVCSGAFDVVVSHLLTAAAAACALGQPPVDAASFDPEGWVDRLVDQLTSGSALEAAVAAHRLDWTTVRASSVTVGRREVAEELRHQVVSDGSDLARVAAAVGADVVTTDDVLSAYAPEIRPVLAGAGADDVVGPVRTAGGWTVVHVVRRAEPALTDPGTRARAHQAVRNEVIGRAVASHVVA
ncbi:MAG: hypothetical protein ACJ72D_10050 [Marmoricola sp.]